MDGRGRIAQSLNFIARLRARPPTGGAPPRRDRARASFPPDEPMVPPTQLQWLVQRTWHRLIRLRVPRGAGVSTGLKGPWPARCGPPAGDRVEADHGRP